MKSVIRVCFAGIVFLAANLSVLGPGKLWLKAGIILLFLMIHLMPSPENRKIPGQRLRICADGCELLMIFLISTAATVFYEGAALVHAVMIGAPQGVWPLVVQIVLAVLVEASVFWNGIIRVYATSAQMGLRWRVIGLICGCIPIVHLFVLRKIIRVAYDEVLLETEKILRNRERSSEQICDTRYPILMVHGVFFRDFQYFNYWGRIPAELIRNGARIYYGNHQSAASVSDSGAELADRIHQVLQETGCEKVNIIAHSKGGLDCRYAVSRLGMAPFVASLTTINTPHRGCIFADYLLDKIPKAAQRKVAAGYNRALRMMGDETPDFMAAVTNLTASFCERFNQEVPDCEGIYYQSVGSKLNVAGDGRFPLNFTNRLVDYFDGPNDGLVAETSFPWGEEFTFLTTEGNRGISHGDMIDLNRENIRDFDVREFYVDLVQRLKERGL